MEAELLEPEPEHLPRRLGGEPVALRVGMEAPADLALPALGIRELEHELADHASRRRLHDRDQDSVALVLDPRLLDAPFEEHTSRVEVHGLPAQVATDVLASEQVVDRREVV